jgi:GTPase SAR1 family protein
MIDIDEAKRQFQKYKTEIEAYIEKDLSESDTRSKVIDNLIINVLGWSESDVIREKHSEAGYYDYRISIPGISFIIEAKRQFNELTIPSNHKKTSIKSLYNENKDVIDQIRGYCMECGVQYGVITNGRQYIFLKLINTDSKNWKDNQCLLFNGLKEIEERFIHFYDNISKFGIVNNGGFKYDLPSGSQESKTIISTLLDKDKEIVRNSLSSKIAPIINRIFGEIFSEEQEDDLEFIERCFVRNEETKKNKEEIEHLFADRAPDISNIIPAVNIDSIKDQISDEIKQDDISIKNLNPPKPIIIIGSKGAGKTTFINHLFKYNMENEDIENHLTVYLDLRKFFNKTKYFEPDKVAKEILELIYDKYSSLELHSLKVLKRIYYKQIKRNDESIWAFDRETDEKKYNSKLVDFLQQSQSNDILHLEHLSKYITRERRKRLIVIIDNADQFDNEIQAEVFMFAHSLAKTALCGTVVSLREGYYYRWRLSPPFDAYESNVYHITAPKYSEVLQKRIDFTLEKITLERDTIGEAGPRTEITNQSVIEFLSGLKNSLFSDQNSDLLDFLNYTTYPNIREGLKVFRQFLTSGHTNVSDYIQRERFRSENRESAQTIPLHEFVKSIGLQNKH